jgi:hypothetical protein
MGHVFWKLGSAADVVRVSPLRGRKIFAASVGIFRHPMHQLCTTNSTRRVTSSSPKGSPRNTTGLNTVTRKSSTQRPPTAGVHAPQPQHTAKIFTATASTRRAPPAESSAPRLPRYLRALESLTACRCPAAVIVVARASCRDDVAICSHGSGRKALRLAQQGPFAGDVPM